MEPLPHFVGGAKHLHFLYGNPRETRPGRRRIEFEFRLEHFECWC